MHVHTYVWPRDGVEKERMVFRQMSEGIFTQFLFVILIQSLQMHPWHTLERFLILLLGSHSLGLLLTHLWSWVPMMQNADQRCPMERVEKERLEEADFSSPSEA